MSTEIFRYPTALEAAEACGGRILALLNEARQARGVAMLAISGGSTPRLMFESMARREFDWSGVQLFWVDERMVPPDDAQSNYRMTRESLLSAIRIPAANVHRIAGEAAPEEAAAAYITEIRRVFALKGDELPAFDVVQRGMGPDMHTASLFPGEPLIENRTDIAAAVWVEKMKQHRVTLLRGVLERARRTLCLVSGEDKAAALRSVLREPPDPMRRPSQIESPAMEWYVDDAAYDADPASLTS
ncbi:MAG TPA: 6-phosphogluconolactonase [Bryobacteraceae bacterium]|nr:6-phosphogluconolactonase [Bryobacteraceae bacterium]